MTGSGRLDNVERGIRAVLAAALFLLAWGYGWVGVVGIGAIVLGAYSLITALGGWCPLAALFGREGEERAPVQGVVGLLRDPRMGLAWLAARLWLGWIWLHAGWEKITDSAWVGSDVPAGINGFLTNASSPEATSGPFPPVSSWYAWLIENAWLPADTFFSYLIAIGQVAVGIALLIGLFTAASAFFGAFMNLNFMLAGALGAGENPIMFGLSLGIVFCGSAAYVYGVDRFTMPALKRIWRKYHSHVRHRPTPAAP